MSTATIPLLEEATRKAFSTAQARAALRGVSIHCIEGDFGVQFIATQWARTKHFDDLAEVEAWLERVDGRRA